MRKKYGEDKVKLWRRSYSVKPPLLSKDDDRYPDNDPRYNNLVDDELPLGECLKDTVERVIPYWKSDIKKSLLEGKNVIVVAHGNSLRALVKYLENISDEDIINLEIPTGKPYVYELSDDLR